MGKKKPSCGRQGGQRSQHLMLNPRVEVRVPLNHQAIHLSLTMYPHGTIDHTTSSLSPTERIHLFACRRLPRLPSSPERLPASLPTPRRSRLFSVRRLPRYASADAAPTSRAWWLSFTGDAPSRLQARLLAPSSRVYGRPSSADAPRLGALPAASAPLPSSSRTWRLPHGSPTESLSSSALPRLGI